MRAVRRAREGGIHHDRPVLRAGDAGVRRAGGAPGRRGRTPTVDGYLDVMKGIFWQTNVSIPVGFIGRDDDNGVYLTITKDEVARHDGAQPPAAVRDHGN